MKIASQILIIILSVSLLFFQESCKDKADDVRPQTGHQVGQFLPEFSLENGDGEIVSLSAFKGKTVLIEFWASWCSYCNAEAPKLNALYNDFKNSDFEIVGISIDESKSDWTAKVKQYDHQYTQLNDPLGWNSPLVADFGVETIPKMILVNAEGQVIFVSTRADKVREALQQRLK